MAETRKDKRAPVSLKVRFKSATVDEFIEQYSKDVSRGGIFIKSGQPMPVGTLLKFQFQLKDESPLIRGVGRVVWTRGEDDSTADQPAGMGIKFIKMDGESRAMVDRIVESHEGAPSSYDAGDTGTEEPAAGQGGGFFPDLPPAQLPPPEDRTAVRHAAQFLASALSGAATDESAAREAEQKADEARRRTAQIEAQRMAEAERIKQAQAAGSGLPSMIIDPTLSDPAPKMAVQGAEPTRAPTSEKPTSPRAQKPVPALIADEATAEDTSVTDRKSMPPQAIPPGAKTVVIAAAPEPKKSSVLPVIVVTAAVIVAAFFALRGDIAPETAEVTTGTENGAQAEPAPEPPVPAEVPKEPTPEPQAAVPTPAPEPAPEPAPAEPAPAPAEMVSVAVSTDPSGADIFVDGAQKGTSPITLELEKGVEVTIRAKAKKRAAKEAKITPGAAKTPLKLTLPTLPYVLHVETTPSGAALNAGTKNGTSPADLTFANTPKGPVPVFARLPGYDQAQAMVPVADFIEGEDAMRASLNLTLEKTPKTKPTPKPAKAPSTKTSPAEPQKEPAATPESTAAPEPQKGPEPASAPAPTPVPTEPAAAPAPKPKGKAKPGAKPAEQPAPAEPIPDNPFG